MNSQKLLIFLAGLLFGSLVTLVGSALHQNWVEARMIDEQMALYEERELVPQYEWSEITHAQNEVVETLSKGKDTWTVYDDNSDPDVEDLRVCKSQGYALFGESVPEVLSQLFPEATFFYCVAQEGSPDMLRFSNERVVVVPYPVAIKEGQVVPVK